MVMYRMQNRIRAVGHAAVFALVALAIAPAPVARADAVPVQMPGTDHWYEYVNGSYSFDEAEALSGSRRFSGATGHIVTITSQAEQDFVNQVAAGRSYAIGARDIGGNAEYNRRWAWVTGPESGQFFSLCAGLRNGGDSGCQNVTGAYANWHPTGEPTGGGETYAFIGYNGRADWTDCTDGGCVGHPGVLVEYEVTPVNPSSSNDTFLMPGTTHRYAAISTPMTWADAHAYAKSLRSNGLPGHLATIESSAEQEFVQSIAPDGGWLGGQATANGWQWAAAIPNPTPLTDCDGGGQCRETSYSHWLPGGPNPPFGQNYALLMGTAERPGDQVAGSVNEGSALSLSAPFGTVFTSVRFASYGTPNGNSYGWCNSSISVERVTSAFIGRASGIIGGNNNVFGDPCYGTYKRLNVVLGYGGSLWRPAPTSETHSFIVEFEPAAPSAPITATARAGDASAIVSWEVDQSDSALAATHFTVVSVPGGRSCTVSAEERQCTVSDLANRTSYAFQVRAENDLGASDPVATTAVTPLAPGVQLWTSRQVIPVGTSVSVFLGNALASKIIPLKSNVPNLSILTDSAGLGSASVALVRPGVVAFAVRSGVTVLSTKVYTPGVAGPAASVRWGSTIRVSLKFAPPGTSVDLTWGGVSSPSVANSAGVATAVFPAIKKGPTTYSAGINGVVYGQGVSHVR